MNVLLYPTNFLYVTDRLQWLGHLLSGHGAQLTTGCVNGGSFDEQLLQRPQLKLLIYGSNAAAIGMNNG